MIYKLIDRGRGWGFAENLASFRRGTSFSAADEKMRGDPLFLSTSCKESAERPLKMVCRGARRDPKQRPGNVRRW